jgi:hypothetical protein
MSDAYAYGFPNHGLNERAAFATLEERAMYPRLCAVLLIVSGAMLVGCEQQSDRGQSASPTAPSAASITPDTLAQSGAASFQYLIGTGPVCNLGPGACPDVSRAPNGDTIAIAGQGTLSIHAKTVTGGGTFTHKAPDGTVRASGTWTATQLLSFNSYGTAPDVPPAFEGGFAVIRIHLSAGHDGILQVNCTIGSPPPNKFEGVRLAVESALNFNEVVSGATLFIRLS